MAKGWLDNYGKEDNYNDYQVSAPKGFRGDGYSNVGRNYSPAWGGQFQMGGSLPGATGHMYARVGAPSNGKYAKHTLASAQDGKKVKYGTPEYEEAYNKGEVITKEGVRSPILLDEVVVKGKKKDKNWLEQYADKIVDENKDAGVLGAILGTPISAVMSLPQLMGMKAFTGEMERPSEALDIENPYGAAAVDIVTDPANLIGAGVLTKEKALARLMASKEAGLLSRTHKLNPWAFKANPEMGYRMLGTEGYQDAINSGVLRAKPAPTNIDGGISLLRNRNRNPNTGKMQGALDRPYFADGFVDDRYASDYMAAVNKTENNLVPIATHKGIAPGTATNIPIENAQFYKKDWLRGYKEVPKPASNFESEIDWAKWNKEIPENSQLIKEYNAIEKTSKANGSWMKNPDGSEFKGTPEQFIQQNSKNFKKAFPNGVDEFYRGNQHFNPEINSGNHSGFDEYITFGTSDKDIAEKYATNGGFNLNAEYQDIGKNVEFYHPDINTPGTYTGRYDDIDAGMYHIGVDRNLEKKIVEGNNERWFNVDDPEILSWKRNENPDFRTKVTKGFDERQIDKVSTDNIAAYIANKQIPLAKVKNLNDDLAQFNGKSSDIIMINPKLAKPKSLRYNNGMFDVTNPNIYKAVVPGAIGLGALQQKKDGGVIKDDMGQWAHPGEITEINSNDITMEGVPYDVLGVSDTGDTKLMKPGKNYKFKGKKVTEYPMAKNGLRQEQKGLQNLDQLTNFTNYNTKQPGGWLDEY